VIEAPNPLAPVLARILRDAQERREMLGIALALVAEREQDCRKYQSRYFAILDQYRAAREADADAQRVRAVKRPREAA